MATLSRNTARPSASSELFTHLPFRPSGLADTIGAHPGLNNKADRPLILSRRFLMQNQAISRHLTSFAKTIRRAASALAAKSSPTHPDGQFRISRDSHPSSSVPYPLSYPKNRPEQPHCSGLPIANGFEVAADAVKRRVLGRAEITSAIVPLLRPPPVSRNAWALPTKPNQTSARSAPRSLSTSFSFSPSSTTCLSDASANERRA